MRDPVGAVRVCAIDVGSNSVRLLIADVKGDGAVTSIVRAGEPCRLGRGLHHSGVIETAMADRAAGLALDFVNRGRSLGARRFLIGATAALRDATNGEEVAARIAGRCRVPVRILTGEQEAQLVYEAVVAGLGGPARRSSCVVFDLGGGSTEVVSGFGPSAGRRTSLPFGAVSLTERFLRANPPADSEIEALDEYVGQELERRCTGMPDETPVLAGVGGTVTAFGVMDRGLKAYDPDLVEGWLIEGPRLEALAALLIRTSEAERRAMTVLGSGRADIVVAGAQVVLLLARRFRSRGLICSTRGLRYALARMAVDEGAEGPEGGGAPGEV
jgi:exopolyphosphatase/guanosine-5'-triphosphate,3'-diphosphate pyrophosphatase